MDLRLAGPIAERLGFESGSAELRSVAGGQQATAYRLTDGRRRAFIKCVALSDRPKLDAERDGLTALAQSATLAVPAVLGQGIEDAAAWLALEWLEFGDPDAAGFARLGAELAALHRHSAPQHGWPRANFIGAGVQVNTPDADWPRFFFDYRLAPQFDALAERARGFGRSTRRRLESEWQTRFGDHQPAASLLHGDLWRGNIGMLAGGRPVVFDPAVHYGDRECDLAMADLFGGFDPAFFAAYQATWPLPPGWQHRRRYYQLYHLLNHANLFGGHYVDLCRKLIEDLIRPQDDPD